ncbi:MAG TPA: histidine kinase [Blastococcus sp.]|jgi:signal transduction histidine kinase|nr:histidine kinase [Blastococcus sp.]
MTVARRALDVVRAWPVVVDSVLAAVLLAAGQLEVTHPDPASGFVGTAPTALSAVTAALIVVPLPWRRRAPMAVLCAVAVLMVAPHLFADVSLPFFGGFVALLIATFTASRRAPDPAATYAVLVPFVVLGVLTFTEPRFDVGSEYVFAVPVFLLVWGAGQALRRWEAQSRRLEAALAELARTHEAQTEAVVLDERARIARELHDVVAHNVSVMLIQSGSARLSMRRAPDRAQEALAILETAGRQAMAEMRNLVGILRPREVADDLLPTPGLEALPELQDTMRRSGLDATIRVVGDRRSIPPGLELSAYRIVQEALTNALKHAGRTRACAVVTFGAEELHLRITNAAPSAPLRPLPPGGGHGVVGMRERAGLYGGHLQTGPSEDGGYVVDVGFPLGVPA